MDATTRDALLLADAYVAAVWGGAPDAPNHLRWNALVLDEGYLLHRITLLEERYLELDAAGKRWEAERCRAHRDAYVRLRRSAYVGT